VPSLLNKPPGLRPQDSAVLDLYSKDGKLKPPAISYPAKTGFVMGFKVAYPPPVTFDPIAVVPEIPTSLIHTQQLRLDGF
jgi:hypothetical protein